MAASALRMQYVNLAHQSETAELGMWAFIASEIMFLGGLFAAYAFYRLLHEAGVEAAAAHTKLAIGSVNTAVLLSSSFVISWASLAARDGESRFAGNLIGAAAMLGMVFLALKGVEYAQEINEHLWPGRFFMLDTDEPRIGEVFYFLYWTFTGLHALHLLVGIGAAGFIATRARRGDYSPAYHTPVRVLTLYWHFVDLVWIFLFVLIYLPGRSL